MFFPLIIAIILATLSIIVAMRLSERHTLTDSEHSQLISPFKILGVVTVVIFIVLSIFLTMGAAAGFVCGIVAFFIMEYLRLITTTNEKTTSLYGLIATAASVLLVSVARLATSDAMVLITLIAGVAVASWFGKRDFSVHPVLRTLIITALGVLGATYFFAGSESAAAFPIMVVASGCAAMLISIFVATHSSWKKPLQLFTSATIAFLIFATLATVWVVPFQPVHIFFCVVAGLACAHACVRFRGAWVRLACVIVALLAGYLIGEFYGIIVALVSFSALIGNTSLLPSAREHLKSVDIFSHVLLILLFIPSVAAAGRSIIFELSDPVLWIGILLSVLLTNLYQSHSAWIFATARRSQLLLLSPVAAACVSVIIFGTVRGIIVITGLLAGFILRMLFSADSEEAAPTYHTLIIVWITTMFLFVHALLR